MDYESGIKKTKQLGKEYSKITYIREEEVRN